jgi:hypothetical protein
LIALFAHANAYPLVYIPRAIPFIADPRAYFFASFQRNNFQLMRTDSLLENAFQTYSVFPDDALAITRFMTYLGSRDSPVFYVIDEHNEYFKGFSRNGVTFLPSNDWILHHFTKWTGCTYGKHTFALYAGSAHSTFLQRLPGGEHHRVRYITPMDDSDFFQAISNVESPIYFDRFKDIEFIEKMKFEVGKVYKFLYDFKVKYRSNFDRFSSDLDKEFRIRLDQWYLDQMKLGMKDEADHNLKNFAFSSHTMPKSKGILFMDPGLVYLDSDGNARVVNEIARRRLSLKWASVACFDPVGKVDYHERGSNFEMQIRKALVSGKDIAFNASDSLGRNRRVYLKLSSCFVPPHFAEFENRNSFEGITQFQEYINTFEETIWIPGFHSFPHVDFLIDTGKSGEKKRSVYCLQVTLQNLSARKDGTREFFKSNKQVRRDIRMRHKMENRRLTKSKLDELVEKSPSYENLRKKLMMKKSEKLVYLLITGADEAGNHSAFFENIDIPKNCEILIVNKTELTQSFDVVF